MIALNATTVTDPTAFTGTGAVTGTIYAVPARTRQSTLAVAVIPALDPGASSFAIQGSLDGINFITVDTISLTTIAPGTKSIPDWPYLFVRVNQVSKTNSVTCTVELVLV